jgi:predicted nuclease of predicted toxin-antitoxin system
MALLIDQNLPRDLERFLARDFVGTVHVRTLGLERATDTQIWNEAKSRFLAIVSKDDDFRHRSAVHGHPPKVILIRRGNCSTAIICAIIAGATPAIEQFLADLSSPLLAIE